MVKRILLLVFIMAATAITLPAKTELLNVGYNYYNSWLGVDDSKLSSIGLSFVGIYDNNFYFQLNFNYGMSYEMNGIEVDMTKNDQLQVGGISTILGIGHDFNFGIMGLVLGGGVFCDFNITQLELPSYSYYSSSYYYSTTTTTATYKYLTGGLGLGVNAYIKFNNFVINVGLMGAWNPLSYSCDHSYGELEETINRSQTQYSANIGIGWSL